LRAAEARLNILGRQADTKPLELALTKIDEAQRIAGQLNQDANALAAAASKAINDVLDTTVKRQRAVGETAQADGSIKEKEGAT
jgi:hypothetical protein